MKTKNGWAVWFYILLYFILLILQNIKSIVIPIDGATYALMLVVGGYVGVSQFAAFVSTKKLPDGIRYTGCYDKLRSIVVAMMILSITARISTAINPAPKIPVDNVLLAAGLAASLFVSGNKAAVSAEKKDSEK